MNAPLAYPPANIPNAPLTDRRRRGLEYQQQIILQALSFLRTLTVDECCELADLYVSLNISPDLQRWARRHKNMPIMHRAFFACLNLAQWGSVRCPK